MKNLEICSNNFLLPLSQNRFCRLDFIDFEWAKNYTWHYRESCKGGYAARVDLSKGYRNVIWLHREILIRSDSYDILNGFDTDHINRDKLDNRRENLRPALRRFNCANREKNKNNKSGYKGVDYVLKLKGYRAQILVQGKKKNLGYYGTPEEAALAYNDAALEAWGDFAYINHVEAFIVPQRLSNSKNKKDYVFKGVSYYKKSNKWMAYAKNELTNKRIHIGYYPTISEAQKAYDQFKSNQANQ